MSNNRVLRLGIQGTEDHYVKDDTEALKILTEKQITSEMMQYGYVDEHEGIKINDWIYDTRLDKNGFVGKVICIAIHKETKEAFYQVEVSTGVGELGDLDFTTTIIPSTNAKILDKEYGRVGSKIACINTSILACTFVGQAMDMLKKHGIGYIEQIHYDVVNENFIYVVRWESGYTGHVYFSERVLIVEE